MPSYVKEYWEIFSFDHLDSRFFTKKYTKAALKKAASYLCKLEDRDIILVPIREKLLMFIEFYFLQNNFIIK